MGSFVAVASFGARGERWLRSARVASFGAGGRRAVHALRRSPRPPMASFGAIGFVRRRWLRSAQSLLFWPLATNHRLPTMCGVWSIRIDKEPPGSEVPHSSSGSQVEMSCDSRHDRQDSGPQSIEAVLGPRELQVCGKNDRLTHRDRLLDSDADIYGTTLTLDWERR
jgi:hypothetical protein